jgi:hypothetical protein
MNNFIELSKLHDSNYKSIKYISFININDIKIEGEQLQKGYFYISKKKLETNFPKEKFPNIVIERIDEFYPDYQGEVNIGKLVSDTITINNAPKRKNINEIDILNRLITLNGHGTHIATKFKVPDNIYVMIPNKKGLDRKYKIGDDQYECKIYDHGFYNFQDFFDATNQPSGWKLYKPNEEINDMFFEKINKKCRDIDEIHKNLKKKCIKRLSVNEYEKICPIYVTATKITATKITQQKYNDKFKLKIKICHNTTLQYLLNNIVKQLKNIELEDAENISPFPCDISKNKPILIIPFTCNFALENCMTLGNCPNDEKKLDQYFKSLNKNE